MINSQNKNLSIINSYIDKDKCIILLNSYPRSGNTWIRMLTTDLILQSKGHETRTKLPIGPDIVFPDIHADPITQDSFVLSEDTLLIKTHLQKDFLEKNIRNFHNVRNIVLYRDPIDSLVSYFHFSKKYDLIDKDYSVDKFCKENASKWNRFYKSYNEPNNCITISYENTTINGPDTMAKLCEYLKINNESASIKKALANMSFKNLQNLEFSKRKENRFFREGKIGNGRSEVSTETLRSVRNATKEIHEKLNKAENHHIDSH